MDFSDLVNKRRSVRAFKEDEVEEGKLKKILEAANSAPSAGDLQAYEIMVVKDHGRKSRLGDACYGQDFIAEAPVALVFLANPSRSEAKYSKRGVKLYCIQDATIAAAYAQLMAAELGLGTVWVGAFDDKAVADVVSAEEGLLPVAVMPVGYSKDTPEKTSRRNLDDIAHFL